VVSTSSTSRGLDQPGVVSTSSTSRALDGLDRTGGLDGLDQP
jgi:hypothetical protein